MIKFLLAQRMRQAKRYFSQAGLGRFVTVVLLAVVGLGVASGVYELLQTGLSAVAGNEFLKVALPFFVYEMFLLVVSGLVFFSVLLTGAFALFRSEEDTWIVASPSFTKLVYDKFIGVSSLSLWPLLVIALPALLAVNTVFVLGIDGLVFALIAVSLLALVSATLAFCLLLTLAYIVHVVCRTGGVTHQFRWFVLSVGLVVLGVVSALWLQFSGVDIASLFSVTNLQLAEANIDQVTNLFVYFPSHLAALVLQAAQTNALAASLTQLLGLVGLAVLSTLAMMYLSGGYIESWQMYHEGGGQSHQEDALRKRQANVNTVFSDNPAVSLIRKEALALFRNIGNQLWGLFLLLLWLITVVFDSFMRAEASGETFFGIPAVEFIQIFQLLVSVYFVAALSVRFVFPSFSLEKEQAWSLLSAPVSLVKLFWAKASFFAGVLALLSAVVAGLHIVLLQISGLQALIFVVLSVVAAVTVAVMGLALGAVFPNFQTTNPDVLATTLPGLSYVLLSLVYGSVASLTLYYVFSTGQAVWAWGFLAGSLLLVGIFSYLAGKTLPEIEFEQKL